MNQDQSHSSEPIPNKPPLLKTKENRLRDAEEIRQDFIKSKKLIPLPEQPESKDKEKEQANE